MKRREAKFHRIVRWFAKRDVAKRDVFTISTTHNDDMISSPVKHASVESVTKHKLSVDYHKNMNGINVTSFWHIMPLVAKLQKGGSDCFIASWTWQLSMPWFFPSMYIVHPEKKDNFIWNLKWNWLISLCNLYWTAIQTQWGGDHTKRHQLFPRLDWMANTSDIFVNKK